MLGLIVVSYLLGSICTAIIVCRLFGLPDPRTTGSNNPGATNVQRIAGTQFALLVLLCDFSKGLIPVLCAKAFGLPLSLISWIGLAAVIGHVFPLFFSFKGGKGVATALGVLIGIDWRLGGMVILTWILVATISRYSSLAAMIALGLAPLYAWWLTDHLQLIYPLFFLSSLILYKHRSNIQRLVLGKEPKIKSFSKKKGS